jgi:hypothetical protein
VPASGTRGDAAADGTQWVSLIEESALETIRDCFRIPESVVMRIPASGEGEVASAGSNEVCLTVQILDAGLKFPILCLVCEVLEHLSLAPAQLQPNGWRMIIASAMMWSEFFKAEGCPQLTLEEFWYMYKQEGRRNGVWKLHSCIPAWKLVDLPGWVLSLKELESKFFFVSWEHWEYPGDEVRHRDGPIKFRRRWGKPLAKSSNELPLTALQLDRLDRILQWA